MGGAWFQEVFGSPEDVTEHHFLDTATQAVRSHLGITAAPIYSKVALQKVRISVCWGQKHTGGSKNLCHLTSQPIIPLLSPTHVSLLTL